MSAAPLPLIPVGDAPQKKKRRKPMKCSALTTQHYQKQGWRPAFVERYVESKIPGQQFPLKRRFDAWGAFDHIVFHPDKPIIRGVNSCAYCDISKHVATMLANPRVYEWLASDPVNRRVDIIGWKRGAPGKKPHGIHRAITLDMFVEGKPPEPEKKPRKAKDITEAAEAIACSACGVRKSDQIKWSERRPDQCWVCANHDNPPSAWRKTQAIEINAKAGV